MGMNTKFGASYKSQTEQRLRDNNWELMKDVSKYKQRAHEAEKKADQAARLECELAEALETIRELKAANAMLLRK